MNTTPSGLASVLFALWLSLGATAHGASPSHGAGEEEIRAGGKLNGTPLRGEKREGPARREGAGSARTAEAPRASQQFTIGAQSLSSALRQYADQTGDQVVFFSEIGKNQQSSAVNGSFTHDEALSALLKNTGLRYERIGPNTIAITSSDTRAAKLSHTTLRLAQSESRNPSSRAGQGRTRGEGEGKKGKEEKPHSIASETEELFEVLVTGTHIRGAAPAGSPLTVFAREQIELTGSATVQQFLELLPQHFGGDASEDIGVTLSGNSNFSGGSAVNLRGLGSVSTLTLVNGRRMTQSGGLGGDFVDISALPLTAIDRVEILSDGASAVYGSDAIAGVINFILRDDYTGSETRARYGVLTEGGAGEYQLGHTFGRSWTGGNALISYEFYKREALGMDERSYTASSDLRPLGGSDFRVDASNPATIVFPALAAVPSGQDGSGLLVGDLLAGQRNLQNQNLGTDVLPSQERHSVFLTARQALGTAVEVFGDLWGGRRDFDKRVGGDTARFLRVPAANPNFVSPVPGFPFIFINYNFIEDLGPRISSGEVTHYHGTLGATVGIGATWQLQTYGSYAREKTESTQTGLDRARLAEALGSDDRATTFNPAIDGFFNPFADGSNTPRNVLDYINAGGFHVGVAGELVSISAQADGELLEFSAGGSARLAVGAEHREEQLDRDFFDIAANARVRNAALSVDARREVSSGFAEISLNVGPLAASAAARFSDYSDFGSTTDPKIGLTWSPVRGLKVRGSWGTSFRAPNLSQSIPGGQTYIAFNLQDPASPTGSTQGLILLGTNPDLAAETSSAWTAGLDIHELLLDGLSLSLTGYNIDFEDRIALIPGSFTFALLDPDLWGPVTTVDPDDTLVQSLLDSPHFNDVLGRPEASAVGVVVDGRFRNLAHSEVTGLDLALGYTARAALGTVNVLINASRIFDFKQQVTRTAGTFDIVGTARNPADLRLRAGAGWQRGGFYAGAHVNYTDSYTDDVSVPAHKIDRWVTLDVNVSYDSMERLANFGLDNTRFSLHVRNLFDEDPPFFNNSSGIGYDPANADPQGRLLSLTVTKTW